MQAEPVLSADEEACRLDWIAMTMSGDFGPNEAVSASWWGGEDERSEAQDKC
jgi:hypothetical protein